MGSVGFSKSALVALVVAALVAVTLTSVLPASAAAPAPTMSVTTAGSPASNVSAGQTLDVAATGPIQVAGSTQQTITNTWDTSQVGMTSSTFVAPTGWTKEYTTDGSSWSSVAPADPSTISGVRASGAVIGNSSGEAVLSNPSGSLVQSAAAFTSGGDGWNVFFHGDQVLNVFHHVNNQFQLQCHVKSTGASCGASQYILANYQTPMNSTGFVYNDKVYSYVTRLTAPIRDGVLCTDVSTLPFTDCGFTALSTATSSVSGQWFLGSSTQVGTKIFAPNAQSGGGTPGKVMCFDMSTQAACGGQPYGLAGFSAPGQFQTHGGFSITVDDRIFVTANKVWCFTVNASSLSTCSGWPSAGAGSFSSAGDLSSVIPWRSNTGTLLGVCLVSPSHTCFDLSSAAVTAMSTSIPSLDTYLTGNPPSVWLNLELYYALSASRQYWWTGANGSNPPQCWDWTTGAACTGFQTSTGIGTAVYALTQDPNDINCIWTNGDAGNINQFNAITGVPGCNKTMTFVSTTAPTRVACSGANQNPWVNLTVNTTLGLSATDTLVTVYDSDGNPLPDFTNLVPNGSGVVDLSGLSITNAGTTPTFNVTANGGTSQQVAGITTTLNAVLGVPELCFSLVAKSTCAAAALPINGQTLSGVTAASMSWTGTLEAATSGCPTPTPTPTATSTATPTPNPTATPEPEPIPTTSPSPTPAPSPESKPVTISAEVHGSVVNFTGTTGRHRTKVFLYRCSSRHGVAKLVRTTTSKGHVWTINGVRLKRRDTAYFMALVRQHKAVIRVKGGQVRLTISGRGDIVPTFRC